jgi:hypothetical protein
LFAGSVLAVMVGYPLALLAFATWLFRATRKLPAGPASAQIAAEPNAPAWEYRSRLQWLSLPLVHIRFGGWFGGQLRHPMGKYKPVTAWIAASDSCAVGGLFAYGAVAIAPISVGAVAIGLFSWGAMAYGALALGAFAVGIWADGAMAFGGQAFGDCAVAWNAAMGGQYAIAHYFALGQTVHAVQANTPFVERLLESKRFFQVCGLILRPWFYYWVWAWVAPMTFSGMIQMSLAARKRRRRQEGK